MWLCPGVVEELPREAVLELTGAREDPLVDVLGPVRVALGRPVEVELAVADVGGAVGEPQVGLDGVAVVDDVVVEVRLADHEIGQEPAFDGVGAGAAVLGRRCTAHDERDDGHAELQ